MSEEEIASYQNCRLGKWYYGLGKTLLGDKAIFKELEEPHMLIHELAKSCTGIQPWLQRSNRSLSS